ncbi:hypothetical protein NPIL_477601 [Nephila pilipes]|uniref:Uncharacterized protein n=1 Tax=Nephila pilipes TaxID=299642 RepID=A0A8X6PX08_NEPPI|nr:hypothetical protein NPIL_477601 [Nephila pilipes]
MKRTKHLCAALFNWNLLHDNPRLHVSQMTAQESNENSTSPQETSLRPLLRALRQLLAKEDYIQQPSKRISEFYAAGIH